MGKELDQNKQKEYEYCISKLRYYFHFMSFWFRIMSLSDMYVCLSNK